MGGAFLSKPITTKNTCVIQHSKIRVITSEMQGWRKHMEDATLFHRLAKEIFLFAIFDGHGGPEVSQYCARHFVSLIQNNHNFINANYTKALEQTFKNIDQLLDTQQAERQLIQISQEYQLQSFSGGSKIIDSVGSTANVLLMVENTIYLANAGDSRAALSRNGKIIELSKDHKPDDPVEKRRILASGAQVQKGRINGHLNLSRSIGDYHYKRNQTLGWQQQTMTSKPQIIQVRLRKQDDFIIMGCDGIWQRYQTNGQGLIDEIRSERLKGKKPEVVLEEFLDKNLAANVNEQFGCDNMSVILIEFNKNLLPTAQAEQVQKKISVK